MQGCHDDIGHLGVERMLNLLQDRFYWPIMPQDVENHVRTCGYCLRFKAKPEVAELNPILVTDPSLHGLCHY